MKTKKWCAWILAIMLLFSSLPVLAEGESTEQAVDSEVLTVESETDGPVSSDDEADASDAAGPDADDGDNAEPQQEESAEDSDLPDPAENADPKVASESNDGDETEEEQADELPLLGTVWPTTLTGSSDKDTYSVGETATVSVYLSDENSYPLSGATVFWAVDAAGLYGSVMTDDYGYASIELDTAYLLGGITVSLQYDGLATDETGEGYTAAYSSVTFSVIDPNNILTPENFPDEVFLSILRADHPYGLSAEEAKSITSFDLSDCGIDSLAGIELFPNLVQLNCSGNFISELDVSHNTKLIALNCMSCSLYSLNVSANKELTILFCSFNSLTSLDLSQNTKLQYLRCSYNSLAALDLSHNSALTDWYAEGQSAPAQTLLKAPGGYLLDMSSIVGAGNLSRVDSCYFDGIDGEWPSPGPSGIVFSPSSYGKEPGYFSYSYETGAYRNSADGYGTEIDIQVPLSVSAAEISIEPEYYIVSLGDVVNPVISTRFGKLYDKCVSMSTFYITDETPLEGDDHVLAFCDDGIQAIGVGTGYVCIDFMADGHLLATAKCRVDVTADPVEDAIIKATLKTPTVTAELYKTDYTQVEILLELDQLKALTGLEETAKESLAIKSAAFIDGSTAAQYFDLNILNDRYLELVPKSEIVERVLSGAKGILTKVKGNIVLSIGNSNRTVTTDPLTVTVKKTAPTVKATALKFNAYVPYQGKNITFSNPDVISYSVVSAPTWLNIYPNDWYCWLTEDCPAKASGKILLDVNVKGYEGSYRVTIPVTVATSAPKFTLKKTSVTLTAGTTDYIEVPYTVTGTNMDRYDCMEYGVSISRVTENGTPWRLNALPFTCDVWDDAVHIAADYDDGMNHTFIVYLSFLNKEYRLTVKIQSQYKKPISLGLKAKGTLDESKPLSNVVITCTPKNYNGYYTVQLDSIDATYKGYYLWDATDEFCIDIIGGDSVQYIIYQADDIDGTLQYYAYISLFDENDDWLCTQCIKLSVRAAKTSKYAPAIQLSTKGKLDVLRPWNAELTVNVQTNIQSYRSREAHFIKTFDGETGSYTWENADYLFDYYFPNKREMRIYTPSHTQLHTGDKYLVYLIIDDVYYGDVFSNDMTIPLTMGKVGITADTKSVGLLKDDRFDSCNITLSPDDTMVKGVSYVTLDATSAKWFDIVYDPDLRSVTLKWKNDTITPDIMKVKTTTKTVKLNVFCYGNLTTKPNTTISVKVTVR